MTTDRQLVERLVLPGMMQAILRGIEEGVGKDAAELGAIVELLGEALREPLNECDPGKHGKLARRAARVATLALTSVTTAQTSYAAQWLAVAKFVVALTEDEVIQVADGSAFDMAWSAMLGLGFGQGDDCDEAEADSMASEIRTRLSAEGYFVCRA